MLGIRGGGTEIHSLMKELISSRFSQTIKHHNVEEDEEEEYKYQYDEDKDGYGPVLSFICIIGGCIYLIIHYINKWG